VLGPYLSPVLIVGTDWKPFGALRRFGGCVLPEGGGETSIPLSARSGLLTMPDGAFDQDGVGLVLQHRKITRRMIITDDIDDTVDNLLSWLGRGRRILVAKLRDDITRRQTWAKMVSVEREMKSGYLGQQPLVIGFEQDYPFWIATDDEPFYLDHGHYLDAGLLLDAGHVEVQSITGVTTAFTISNTGVAAVVGGELTINPGTSITNVRIENAANGMAFEWLGTLVSGDALTVDFLSRSVQHNNENDYASFAVPEAQIDWMRLELGDNPITVHCDAVDGTGQLRWRWARHYL